MCVYELFSFCGCCRAWRNRFSWRRLCLCGISAAVSKDASHRQHFTARNEIGACGCDWRNFVSTLRRVKTLVWCLQSQSKEIMANRYWQTLHLGVAFASGAIASRAEAGCNGIVSIFGEVWTSRDWVVSTLGLNWFWPGRSGVCRVLPQRAWQTGISNIDHDHDWKVSGVCVVPSVLCSCMCDRSWQIAMGRRVLRRRGGWVATSTLASGCLEQCWRSDLDMWCALTHYQAAWFSSTSRHVNKTRLFTG